MSITPTRRDPYDAMPYVSMPIAYTQPALLAAQVHLRGIAAPPAETASVLEIGAASGGNIIPLAARFPRAQFHGVDLAAAHIDIGQRRIAELGLSNVTLEQGDICDADFGKRRFDYIICHGVFSWAPAEAQRAILKVCADTLADTGIAAISYNVFPGWHTRNVIRAICLAHTRDGGSPGQRVEAVRELLKSIAETSSDKSPYGAMIRGEAARLKTRPASYILGEFLAVYNQPFHVRDVIGQAAKNGLAYLGEAELAASAPEYVAPAAAQRIRAFAGSDPVAVEQYTDMFTGRAFRRSLFARAGCHAQTPLPQRLLPLHLTSSARAQAADPPADPATAAAHAILTKPYPASVAVADLVASSGQSALAPLYDLLARGRASVSTAGTTVGRADQSHPNVWRVARGEVATGQPWVTNFVHEPVLLTPLLRVLIPLMDGATTRDQLTNAVESSLRSGALSDKDLPRMENGGAANRLASIVDRLVTHCARNALLAT